jgi:hypothetical protein
MQARCYQGEGRARRYIKERVTEVGYGTGWLHWLGMIEPPDADVDALGNLHHL